MTVEDLRALEEDVDEALLLGRHLGAKHLLFEEVEKSETYSSIFSK